MECGDASGRLKEKKAFSCAAMRQKPQRKEPKWRNNNCKKDIQSAPFFLFSFFFFSSSSSSSTFLPSPFLLLDAPKAPKRPSAVFSFCFFRLPLFPLFHFDNEKKSDGDEETMNFSASSNSCCMVGRAANFFASSSCTHRYSVCSSEICTSLKGGFNFANQ